MDTQNSSIDIGERISHSPSPIRYHYPPDVTSLILAIETSNPSAAEPGPDGLSRCAGVALARLIEPDAGESALRAASHTPVPTPIPTPVPAAASITLPAPPPEPPRLETLGVAWLGPSEAQGLMPTIDALFARAGASPRDLARVGVSIGPGGYTSIRVAVTAAKVICEATGAACVPLPTADVVAARVDHDAPFCIALASKRETAWFTLYEPGTRAMDKTHSGSPPHAQPRHLRALGLRDASVIDDLIAAGATLLVVDRFCPPEVRARATSRGLAIREPIFDPSAALALAASREAVDPLTLAPLYPREPEAVSKWRTLHPPKGSSPAGAPKPAS